MIRPEGFLPALSGVVGQPDMKRKLAAAFSQYTRYCEDPSVGRPTVCLFGPTGTGKTFAVETLARSTDLAFTSVSAAAIAVVSYKGLTLRDVLAQHYRMYKTDTGVIFLDEVDKWTVGALGTDVELRSQGMKIQAELLRLLEAEEVDFAEEAEDDESLKGVRFRTDKIMWVMAGAFVGMESLVRHRLHNYPLPAEECWKATIPSDFMRYGFLSELVGRVSTWAYVLPLKMLEIVRITKEQEVPRWVSLFASVGCDLIINDGALGRAAEAAFFDKTGARGAMAFLRKSLEDIYVEVSAHHITALTVDARTVTTGRLELESSVA
jgi:ATP-dependent Clp protease ATP-binding subunit ClpX